MTSSFSKNRPGSARRAMENDPLRRKDLPATGLTEADFSSLIDAIAFLQTVDLNGLRRRLNSTAPQDLKNGEDGHDADIRWAENVDWKKKCTDLKEKYDTLTAQLKTTEQTSSEQKKELVVLQQRVESDDQTLKSLNQKLKEHRNDLESKEKRLQIQQKEMEEVKKAKDDALTRLSRQMGQQMLEGNPNITDLSDQNRPSKLGEIYSELYDNEWTNAFEVLTETFDLDDKSAIELLLKILWESSKHASVVSQSTMKKIEKLLSGSSEGPTPDCKRLLKEARKHVDIKKADDLFQDFVREKLTSLVGRVSLGEEKVKIYSEKCFQLCWLMSIQDPPVILSKDPERGAQFDTNLYKHYTNSGNNVDYVVWPALLLHKDGPLLAKGVAQPSPKPRTKSSPAVGRHTTRDDKSFDRRSKTQHDTKEQEPTSGSHGMDKTHNGHQDRNDEKVRQSTSGFDRMENMKYGYQSRNDKKVRESTSGFNWMDKTQYGYQSRNDEKVRESTSRSDRMDNTQYGYQDDATLSSQSGHGPMVTQTYSADGGKYRVHTPTPTARAQGQVSGRMQLDQPHVFRNEYDRWSFERFCQNVALFDEPQLRKLYGTDYYRYYNLHVNQTYGSDTFV